MRFEWFAALRYLRSENKPAVLRLVTWLSVASVAAGVATLEIALAMNTGFRHTLTDRLLEVTAQVNIKPNGLDGIRRYRALMARLKVTPGVREVAPAIYNTVLLVGGGQARGIVLKGIDPPLEARADAALRHVVAGRADFAPDANGIDSILVGSILAGQLKLAPGQYVTLTSPQGTLTPFGMVPRTRRFRVAGVFDSGFYDYDANWAFVTLRAAQELAGTGDLVSLLEVRLDDPGRAREMARVLGREAGPDYTTSTWMEENRALFRALSLEKLVTALFLGLITFVAGLNILMVLAMTVAEKARDVAVLVALGAERRQVRNLFLFQGLAVGAVGTAIGLVLGYGLAYVANRWRMIPLNPEVYSISYLPFHSKGLDAVWIAAVALAISLAATVYPARAAARIFPVEILRYE
jgi:lipoprotein-releasing system permease protein